MEMMTNLSPQAQEILDAFNGYNKLVNRRVYIAAALRALTKQYTFADTAVNMTEKVVLVDHILSIAKELEQNR